MPPLRHGLYETLVTKGISSQLQQLESGRPLLDDLRDAEAGDRIAWHIASIVERAINLVPEANRLAIGTELAARLIDQIVETTAVAEFADERLLDPAAVLRAVSDLLPDGTIKKVEAPLIPLLDSALLTNSPGEPNVGHQIAAEIASADRIDLVMAFIRRTGILPLLDTLRAHVAADKRLRVLTTTYTGSTEGAALQRLQDIGAEVRVSYDSTSTRLHAKAWLFYRNSGFSTAYIGSSNLTHWAQVTGLEWNVRLSGARNRSLIDKIGAVFESYWQQPDFEPYDRDRFTEALGQPARDHVILSPTEVRLEPFQERLLEQIELSRRLGHHRNLLASATGTGKTVMAAVDYARLRKRLPRSRLLFVAHREEILHQARATFAYALRDASFGELWVGGDRPRAFEHVFASIQSLSANGLGSLNPDHFDVVIIDEFHHAAADSYRGLLERLVPKELLGLTATPERSDGVDVLQWFDDRIAAELRLWDAIDQHRLVPFSYYGIADDLDLRQVPWRRGTGYDVEGLTEVITGTDVWARSVLKQFLDVFGNPPTARALGFCVGVEHARYMARVFNTHGVPATAVLGTTHDEARRNALRELELGSVNVVFSVDLFNEGVDVPAVDAILMLRPTESPVLFMQQLGRGLRKSPNKAICTVLDFVAHHRTEFRYDRRFRALLGGTRKSVKDQVEKGFPFLPAGCHMQLDRLASERILDSLRNALPRGIRGRATELMEIAREHGDVDLRTFLDYSGFDLEDVYADKHSSWSDLRERAGLRVEAEGRYEKRLRNACGRMLHVDDPARLQTWSAWLRQDSPPRVDGSENDARLLRMLTGQVLQAVPDPDIELREGAGLIWAHPQVRRELSEICEILADRVSHLTLPLRDLPSVPLQVHGRYTRIEILAACGVGDGARVMNWREGVYYADNIPADLFAFTLDKTNGSFSPTTRYRDYAISRDLIHWESQSATRAESKVGRRYREHARIGNYIFLFARLNTSERAFHFLGPATYVSHEGERPMAITWRLHHPLPGDLFQVFAAAVA